jgi:hypothetical protein
MVLSNNSGAEQFVAIVKYSKLSGGNCALRLLESQFGRSAV